MLGVPESGVLLPLEGRLQVRGSAQAGSCAGSSEDLCPKAAEELACWRHWVRPGRKDRMRCLTHILASFYRSVLNDQAVFTAEFSSCDCGYASPSCCSYLHPVLNLTGSTTKMSSHRITGNISL